LELQVDALQAELNRVNPQLELTTQCPSMKRAIELARQVAPTDTIVLLTGENGTGKSVLARAIHTWSKRRGKPFSEISCPSLSPELLESELFGHAKGSFTGATKDHFGRISYCEGGTLLLDEIGDLPISVQPKILRFIQEREYERLGDHITRKADVRLIAATNMNLEEAVRKHIFREDLYYRLSVFQIEIPPLRDRVDDIANLANRLIAFFAKRHHRKAQSFTEEAVKQLCRYSWPGNVRELRNVVERASILCKSDIIGVEYLPEKVLAIKEDVTSSEFVSLERLEEIHIRRVLANAKSLQEAASILGIDQTTLWRRRKQYNI